jgi:Putative auto-transporter adhesin, head GIN domain
MVRSIIPLFAFALAASAPVLASELVSLPQFDSVELRGGGSVIVVPGPAERVTIVEGSSRFTRFQVRGGQLKIDTCAADCPRSYRLRIEVQSPRVPDLAVNGGGAISVGPGFRPQRQLNTAAKGGGMIDARAVAAKDVAAAVNGGGELLVRAGSTLTSAVSGGGDVRYWGNPRVTTAIQGGGAVRRGH